MTIAAIMVTLSDLRGHGLDGAGASAPGPVRGGWVCIAAANAGPPARISRPVSSWGPRPPPSRSAFLLGGGGGRRGHRSSPMKIWTTPTWTPPPTRWCYAIAATGFPAPRAPSWPTLIKGLSGPQPEIGSSCWWGSARPAAMNFCGVRSLAFAVAAPSLPLSTTLPIFLGGSVRWLRPQDPEGRCPPRRGPGSRQPVRPTGLVAGGAWRSALPILKATAARYEQNAPLFAAHPGPHPEPGGTLTRPGPGPLRDPGGGVLPAPGRGAVPRALRTSDRP